MNIKISFSLLKREVTTKLYLIHLSLHYQDWGLHSVNIFKLEFNSLLIVFVAIVAIIGDTFEKDYVLTEEFAGRSLIY